jgi:outer membrane protein
VKNNNLPVILNVVLLIAVAVLFYLHFSSSKELAAVKETQDSTPNLSFRVPKNLAGARVLYVNVDSINANYLAFTELYQQEGGNLEQEYQRYQMRVNNYQRRYEKLNSGWKGSADSAMIEEKALEAEARSLAAVEKRLTAMQSQAMEKNEIINQEVSTYFKQYSREKGVDYIIAIGAGSPIIYANDSLEVTRDVVEALNAEYLRKKGSGGNPLQFGK